MWIHSNSKDGLFNADKCNSFAVLPADKAQTCHHGGGSTSTYYYAPDHGFAVVGFTRSNRVFIHAETEAQASLGIVAVTDLLTYSEPAEYIHKALDYEARGWLPSALALAMVLVCAGYRSEPWRDVIENLKAVGVPVFEAYEETGSEPSPQLLEIIERGDLEYSVIMGVNRG